MNSNTLRAYPPTHLLSPSIFAPPPKSRDRFCSLNRAQTPRPTTQAQGAKGWGHGALWGYSEALPSGRLFRVNGYPEWKAIPSGRLLRMEGRSEKRYSDTPVTDVRGVIPKLFRMDVPMRKLFRVDSDEESYSERTAIPNGERDKSNNCAHGARGRGEWAHARIG